MLFEIYGIERENGVFLRVCKYNRLDFRFIFYAYPSNEAIINFNGCARDYNFRSPKRIVLFRNYVVSCVVEDNGETCNLPYRFFLHIFTYGTYVYVHAVFVKSRLYTMLNVKNEIVIFFTALFVYVITRCRMPMLGFVVTPFTFERMNVVKMWNCFRLRLFANGTIMQSFAVGSFGGLNDYNAFVPFVLCKILSLVCMLTSCRIPVIVCIIAPFF